MEKTAEPQVEPEANRRRIKKLDVMVAEVIRETHDSSTLVLFSGNESLDYKPGHFLTIAPHQFPGLARWTEYLEDQKGKKEKPRAYSLASAPHERRLAITIKEERYVKGVTAYPPLLSPVLVQRTPPGTEMTITGFTGPYTLPDDIDTQTDHLVHICAGSGIVPNYSIIKHALHHDMRLKHTLVYGNKTWDDIMYRRQLQELHEEHPDQFQVIYCLSREPEAERHGPSFRTGRVTEEVLREAIPDPSAVRAYVCGPGITVFDKQLAKQRGETPKPRFLESALQGLASVGVDKRHITRESYG